MAWSLRDGLDDFVGEGCGGFDFLPLRVNRSAARSKSRSMEAASRSAVLSCVSIDSPWVSKKACTAAAFGVVGGGALGSACLVAGREALLHLLVDTARMLRIGSEIFDAAAELEEVEDGIGVAVGGGAGRERTVKVAEGALREAVGGVDAWVGVLGGEAEEEGACGV